MIRQNQVSLGAKDGADLGSILIKMRMTKIDYSSQMGYLKIRLRQDRRNLGLKYGIG
jgi:hypothetical protein